MDKQTTTQTQSMPVNYVERAIAASSLTAEETTKDLLSVMTVEAMHGTVVWDKNLTLTIECAIDKIDELISRQLADVMHHPSFQKLEGSWLGLQKLVKSSDLGPQLKVKIIDYDQDELIDQFESAPAIDRSHFFNLVYQEEYGTAGGEPFGAMLADYEFSYGDKDVSLLRYLGEVASASHSPLVTAASPAMFDYNNFDTFSEGKPVAAGFDAESYAAWNAFRASDDSRYVGLTLPKTLARLPYSSAANPVQSFSFEELPLDKKQRPYPTSDTDFTWSNAAYEYGLRMTEAFTQYGWCTAIRGAENGGKVENLPNFTYYTDAGDLAQQCPTEVNLTDEREKELSDLGFLPLVHYKNTNYAVFIGAQTAHKPKTYTDPDATANAAISARLPYTMASSRIAQYLKIIGRDRLGSSLEATDVEKELNTWIHQYVNSGAIGNDSKATYPLAEAQVKVEEQVGKPGSYSAVAWLRPWLQMEELTTSLRMVARIPS